MSIKGADDAIAVFKQWQDIISRMHKSEKVVMHDSDRLASAGAKINERGSVRDRLAQTAAEAEAIAGADAIRTGGEATVPTDYTPEQEEALDEAIIDRLIDDLIEKTILKGM